MFGAPFYYIKRFLLDLLTENVLILGWHLLRRAYRLLRRRCVGKKLVSAVPFAFFLTYITPILRPPPKE